MSFSALMGKNRPRLHQLMKNERTRAMSAWSVSTTRLNPAPERLSRYARSSVAVSGTNDGGQTSAASGVAVASPIDNHGILFEPSGAAPGSVAKGGL